MSAKPFPRYFVQNLEFRGELKFMENAEYQVGARVEKTLSGLRFKQDASMDFFIEPLPTETKLNDQVNFCIENFSMPSLVEKLKELAADPNFNAFEIKFEKKSPICDPFPRYEITGLQVTRAYKRLKVFFMLEDGNDTGYFSIPLSHLDDFIQTLAFILLRIPLENPHGQS